jgi:hypothetical protein
MQMTFGVGTVNSVNSCKAYIYMWLCCQTLKPHDRFFTPNYHFYLTDQFPGRNGIPHNHVTMLYVRYVHLTKAKPIHERETHLLLRDDS